MLSAAKPGVPMTQTLSKSENQILGEGYQSLLKEVKEKLKTSQIRAALAVNQELIKLYWEVGAAVHRRQQSEGWGAKTIERLAKDIKSSFPDIKGFSLTNIKYMVQFAREYPDFLNSQQLVGQIPWGHNVILLQKLKDHDERIWYAKKTVENGWSRNVLLHWIDGGLHKRQGQAVTNFESTLPATHSDLARETIKDPYCFDFLTLRDRFDEKELEDGLLDHIQNFLLELGAGFAFVGRQFPLKVGGQEFFPDLLFYHLKLRSYIVVELKATEFKPDYAGKLNFYLTAVDELLSHPNDQPAVGLLLCKTKNKVVAEYALRDINKPIGISEYETKILESLPEELKRSLPSIEALERELQKS